MNCWPGRVRAIHSALFKLSGKLALPNSERGNYRNRLRTPISTSSPWLIYRPPTYSCGYIFRLFPLSFFVLMFLFIMWGEWRQKKSPCLCCKMLIFDHILLYSYKSQSSTFLFNNLFSITLQAMPPCTLFIFTGIQPLESPPPSFYLSPPLSVYFFSLYLLHFLSFISIIPDSM